MTDYNTIRYVTLNVRGLNENEKRNKLFRWLNDKKSDIVFLQETYCTEKLVPYFNTNWPGLVEHSILHIVEVSVFYSIKGYV